MAALHWSVSPSSFLLFFSSEEQIAIAHNLTAASGGGGGGGARGIRGMRYLNEGERFGIPDDNGRDDGEKEELSTLHWNKVGNDALCVILLI